MSRIFGFWRWRGSFGKGSWWWGGPYCSAPFAGGGIAGRGGAAGSRLGLGSCYFGSLLALPLGEQMGR